MSTIPVVGLRNIGNICFINSAFQCLASLKSMQSFLTTQFGDIADEQIFLRMVQNELYQLAKPSQETPRQLSHELLRYIYEKLLFDTFNTQQDVTDQLRGLFQVFKIWASRTFANFQVTATTECYGSKRLDASWGLQLNVSEHENSIDIGQMLSEALFLEPGQVCTCGQNRIHIYGDLPQCLAITVIKLKFNKALQKGFVRQSVQIKCKPTYKIQGFEYEMKAAVEYIGADYIGGGGVCSSLKKITGCDSTNMKRREKIQPGRINMVRDNIALSRYLTLPTSVGIMCQTPKIKIEEETSFDQMYQLPKELATTPVEEERSFNEEKSSSEERESESSLDESFDEATPSQEELAIIQEFLAANESISCVTSNEATFLSKPRNNKPLADPNAGHYMSYVKREDGFYHISDKDVMKVKMIETDDLYVLFYERK